MGREKYMDLWNAMNWQELSRCVVECHRTVWVSTILDIDYLRHAILSIWGCPRVSLSRRSYSYELAHTIFSQTILATRSRPSTILPRRSWPRQSVSSTCRNDNSIDFEWLCLTMFNDYAWLFSITMFDKNLLSIAVLSRKQSLLTWQIAFTGIARRSLGSQNFWPKSVH